MAKLLVVEDDPGIAEVTVFALERAGHAVRHVSDGEAALDAAAREAPDLVVLDVGLPGLDGLGVCRELRKASDVPILFLSARDEEIDRVLGLEIGGDDYVTKPFSPRELVARVGVILRRTNGAPAPGAAVRHGRLSLDAERHEAAWDGVPLSLTATEFGLLRTLSARPGAVLSRGQLMDAAYDGNIHVSDRTIDSHVRNLRGKLAGAGGEGAIETVHGVGFKLGPCEG